MSRRPLHFVAVNWRDTASPEAGGAETHLHEILRRMVARGHRATLFACGFEGGRERETIDGVDVHRAGSWWNANTSVSKAAAAFLAREPADLVIEDINKLPFCMPLRTKVPVLVIVPHLFGASVFREANPALASYVWAWERVIPPVYRRSRFVVISPSTRDDLIARGIGADRIDVVYCGLDHARYHRVDGIARASVPTLVHLGRVRRYKSVDVAVRALARLRERLPDARLVVIGDGPELGNVKALAERLGVAASVDFKGRMGAREMVEELNRCHVFLNPSPKEGWGLTVVEANACGVPVVGSDRPGLRDSIRDGETGFLVPYRDVDAFADRAHALLTDAALWRRMSEAGERWAATFTWERTADEMEEAFLRAIKAATPR